MTIGIWVLGDQLWSGQAALQHCAKLTPRPPVILVEALSQAQVRPYHQQKLVLVWSAMRHFAAELQAQGWPVTYIEAPEFQAPLQHWLHTHEITELQIMQPSDRPFQQLIDQLDLACDIQYIPNNHFLWAPAEFADWARSYKQLRLETFYRLSRKRFGILMAGADPVGGQWNFDKQNRKPPKTGLNPPEPLRFEADTITQAVIHKVQNLACPTFGTAEPFHWAVTRQQAQQVLQHFLQTRLPQFGPYQDAMVTGQATLWHALLSPYLNLGLLQPLEVIQAAEQAYQRENLELAGVEGFIRQVLGWREYLQGLYWYVDQDYFQRNWFQHDRPLPDFFWTGETSMNCLQQVIRQVQQTGYAHHIQRLMVLSNFALIAGLNPQAVEDWFHAVFIDAYDWVMQTNVLGMGLFADGGTLASKPYAASANYINRMSDYCKACTHNPKKRTGSEACPFNFYYWDFLARHREQLYTQGRMTLILKQLDKLDTQELAQIRQQADSYLGSTS